MRNRRAGLERRIAAKEDRVAHAQAGFEASAAGTQHRLVVERICQAKSRLESLAHVNGRVVVRQSMEEVIELAAVRCWNASLGGAREAAPGNHQAVVWIAAARNR